MFDEPLSKEFLDSLTKDDVNRLLKEIDDELRSKFGLYEPYKKQKDFHNSLALERVLSGGNQTGKSYAASMELAMHLTGVYPDWFEGERIKPRKNEQSGTMELNIWVVGTTYNIVRDVLQKNIIGTVDGKFTDGVIPTGSIVREKMKKMSGVPGFVETAKIRHKDGFEATVQFRAYSQGRTVLQSATIDLIYLDEEPPEDILGELQARLTATGGRMFMAFTPLSGMTRLVQSFWKGDDPDKALFKLSVYESGHMTPEKIAMTEKRYKDMSPNERKARLMGEPAMGTGLVYPIDIENVIGSPNSDRHHIWLGAIDFGRGEHPNVVVYGSYDEDKDIIYVRHSIKTVNKSVEEVASRMRKYGDDIMVTYPHDLLKSSGIANSGKEVDETGAGFKYRELYQQEGIKMTYHHARTPEGSMNVEVGLTEVRRRFNEGKLKIDPELEELLDEMRIYRYDENNKPVKNNKIDPHLLDALRYLVVMIRFAEPRSNRDNRFDEGEVYDGTNVFE